MEWFRQEQTIPGYSCAVVQLWVPDGALQKMFEQQERMKRMSETVKCFWDLMDKVGGRIA